MDDDREVGHVAFACIAFREVTNVVEAGLAIRVLATIPDLAPKLASATPPSTRAAQPRTKREVPHTAPPSSKENTLRKRTLRPVDRPRTSRHKKPSLFSSGSITVLAVMAAAIWSYVAVRDMGRPEPTPSPERIAAEPASLGTGKTLR